MSLVLPLFHSLLAVRVTERLIKVMSFKTSVSNVYTGAINPALERNEVKVKAPGPPPQGL